MFVYRIFMTSPLLLAVGPQSLYGGGLYTIFYVCPFDYTAVAVSGKLERS